MDKTMYDFRVIMIFILNEIAIRIIAFYSDFKNWADAIAYFAGTIHNEHMAQAKQIRKEHYFDASKTTKYKRLYTEGEITKLLNRNTQRGKLKRILELTAQVLKLADDVKQSLDGLKKAIKHSRSISKISSSKGSKEHSKMTPEEIEKAMEESHKKFAALMDTLLILNNFSPPIFGEYFEFAASAFKESEHLVKITKEYTQRLRAAANEATKESFISLSRNGAASATLYILNSPHGLTIFENSRKSSR